MTKLLSFLFFILTAIIVAGNITSCHWVYAVCCHHSQIYIWLSCWWCVFLHCGHWMDNGSHIHNVWTTPKWCYFCFGMDNFCSVPQLKFFFFMIPYFLFQIVTCVCFLKLGEIIGQLGKFSQSKNWCPVGQYRMLGPSIYLNQICLHSFGIKELM